MVIDADAAHDSDVVANVDGTICNGAAADADAAADDGAVADCAPDAEALFTSIEGKVEDVEEIFTPGAMQLVAQERKQAGLPAKGNCRESLGTRLEQSVCMFARFIWLPNTASCRHGQDNC